MSSKGSNITSIHANSRLKAFWARLKNAWYCIKQKHYYIVALGVENVKENPLPKLSIKTYNIDNNQVKAVSLLIYNNFNDMDTVSNQVNDILNNPNPN